MASSEIVGTTCSVRAYISTGIITIHPGASQGFCCVGRLNWPHWLLQIAVSDHLYRAPVVRGLVNAWPLSC